MMYDYIRTSRFNAECKALRQIARKHGRDSAQYAKALTEATERLRALAIATRRARP